MLERIARTLGASEIPPAETPQKKTRNRDERQAFPVRSIVFSDTDNDVASVRNTLRFAGVLNEEDAFTDVLEGMTIFHTGDLLDKKNPDPSVATYWQLLQQHALTKGGRVKLIVGNHEQEIWQKIQAGEKFGMPEKQIQWLTDFIESLDLFHVAGPVLFIHGYPTLEFLQTLLHFEEVTGNDVNFFNADHYRKALRSVNGMRQYSYVSQDRKPHYLLYEVSDASRYYKKQGRAVSAVLAALKIDTVIHGHRPQRSGVQADYEFAKWIPNVRMIGNDTRVRRTGIGATIIRTVSTGSPEVIFINTKTASGKLRRQVQADLREVLVQSPTNRMIDGAATGITRAEYEAPRSE
jgi:hypothetical protein